MRLSTVVLALPAIAAAEQVPLMDQVKGWFNKATQAISQTVPSVSNVPVANPVDAAAAKAAEYAVERVTLENHKQVLAAGAHGASGIDNVMLFVTGGNKTCFGLCGHAEAEWNKSAAIVAASSDAPRLAVIDCESEPVLCNAWALGPPSVAYMLLPQPLPDQSTPATSFYNIPLNRTSVTAGEIAAIHTQQKYLDKAPYEGWFHPFDGQLAKLGLTIPFGYAVYYFSLIPSWAMMVGISFFSRTFM